MSDKQETLAEMNTSHNIKTYLGRKGYTIRLKYFTDEQILKIKEDLTFKPFRPRGYGPDVTPSFSVFGISKKKMFLPKFYGIKAFGKPDEVKLSGEKKINLNFNGSLRDNQRKPVEACLKAAEETGGGILCLPCGFGKCLGKDTPVMMYDGTIKMVQDIEVGDLLMGDDSTPRNVLSTCRGKEQLYKVIPKKGEPYIVNESHILSLKCSTKCKYGKKGDVIDISVKDYLNLSKSYHGRGGPLLGYRVSVDFPEKKVDFDPYIIGLWLGDGHSCRTGISTQDSTIIKYLKQNLGKYNMYLQYTGNQYDFYMNSIYKKGTHPRVNHMMETLRKYDLIHNKHIPMDYKCNSKDIRLKVLAGLIDSDGYAKKGGYDIIQKNEQLLDDIIFIARSLGFSAYKKKCQKSCMYKGEKKTGTYYRTNIHGKGLEEIPVLIKRKKVEPRKQIKDAFVTRIHLEKLEVGDYYGFEIDNNRRFLLWDFTVTHNTSIALYLIATLGVKALVVVNKEFLMDQWKERIEQFLPDARVGILRQKKIQVENKDIVIAMLQSVAMCDYDFSVYSTFGIVFYDEAHCVPSKVFSKALRKINTRYHFGLSATPNRADGMTKVTKLYIGPIVYKVNPRTSKKNPKGLQVFTVSFKKLPGGKYYRDLYNYKGKPDVVKMISNLVQCPKRIALISMLLRYFIIHDKRHILVLSERIQYLRDIEDKIKKDLDNKIPFKIGYYIGGMKKAERKESETADLILASYSMAKEAMDIPILDTLLMATSKSNIEQSVGRILRKTEYPEDRPPLVIDMVDKFSSFHNQSFKRIDFYKKKHYPVTSFTFNEDDVKQFYSDIEEGVKKLCECIPDTSEDESVLCASNSEQPKQVQTKPLVQTKIDKSLYNMIGDGDFDI